MKKHEIKVGGHYLARVSGRLVTVRVDSIMDDGAVRYGAINLTTSRRTTFRSAQKFRREIRGEQP